jgi:hypothetical protein
MFVGMVTSPPVALKPSQVNKVHFLTVYVISILVLSIYVQLLQAVSHVTTKPLCAFFFSPIRFTWITNLVSFIITLTRSTNHYASYYLVFSNLLSLFSLRVRTLSPSLNFHYKIDDWSLYWCVLLASAIDGWSGVTVVWFRLMIWYMIHIFNSNWVDTRWQKYRTHLRVHTNSVQNTENGTYITIKKLTTVIWETRAVPRLCELYPGICLTTEKKARKPLS